MRGYLLDTNVISLLSPTNRDVPSGFMAWLASREEEEAIFLSVVAVHELQKGVGLLEAKGASAKAAALRAWLAGLVAAFDSRILPFDTAAATISGALEARAKASGHDPGMADAMVAGIAEASDHCVVTRNQRHFLPFGVAAVSPEDVGGADKA